MNSEEVRRLRELGYALLPIPPRQKEPPPKGWVNHQGDFDIPADANVAIGLRGDVSVLITNDDQATAWAQRTFGDPNVRSVRGAHWYFRARDRQANERDTATSVGRVEFHVRSKYAMIPPSVHPSGTQYAWVRALPAVRDLPEAPDLRDLWHPSGEHHSQLLKMSAAAAHSGKNAEEIFAGLKTWRDAHLKDPAAHPDRDLLKLAESAALKFNAPGTGDAEDGAQLFKDLVRLVRSHYYFEEDWHYTIYGLYVMQAWAVRFGSLPVVFYLFFGGAFSSGKSNVLSLLAQLTDGQMFENVSPSALARVIENGRTVLIDEFDVERGDELDDVLASLLRSGYRRNGPPYVRWNAKEKSAEIIPIFGPKAMTVRGSVDPALSSRAFVIPTAKPVGEQHFDLILANWWPKVDSIVPRLRSWGKQAASIWTPDNLEALAHTKEFQARVRAVAGELGANRESELLTIAMLIAHMARIDVVTSLSSAKALRVTQASEDQAEAIEELRVATLAVMSKTVSFTVDGSEVSRVQQSHVRTEINKRRNERRERPLSNKRLVVLRRELGVKDSWIVSPQGSLVWNLPKAFVDALAAGPAIADAPGGTHTPAVTPPPPHHPTSTPLPHLDPTSPCYSVPAGEPEGVPGGEVGTRWGSGEGYVGSTSESTPAGVHETASPGTEGTWASPEARAEREVAWWLETKARYDAANPEEKERIRAKEGFYRIGPFVDYPDGTVQTRRQGITVWKPGSTHPRPVNPAAEPYDKPHTPRRF